MPTVPMELAIVEKPTSQNHPGGAPPRTRTWLLAMAGCALVHLGVKALWYSEDAATEMPVGRGAAAPGQAQATDGGETVVGWVRRGRPALERRDRAP